VDTILFRKENKQEFLIENELRVSYFHNPPSSRGKYIISENGLFYRDEETGITYNTPDKHILLLNTCELIEKIYISRLLASHEKKIIRHYY